MAFSSGDPVEYGKELADRTKSPWDFAGTNLMDSFKKKKDSDLLVDVDKRKKQNDLEMEEASAKRLMGVAGTGSFMPSEFKVGSTVFRNPKYSEDVTKTRNDLMLERELEKKKMLGAGAESGKMAFIEEALKTGLPSAKKTLFPDGTPKSYDMGAATKSTSFFGGPLPFSGQGQNLYRDLGSSLAARRFMITGQASNQTEVKELVNQFMSKWGSSGDSLYKGIQQMENEFNGYLSNADPSGLFHESSVNQKPTEDARTIYNRLRSQGVSKEEAKRQAGV